MAAPKKPRRAKPRKKAAKKLGRPRLKFDLRLVRELAKLQCTYEEIAACLGCHVSTITDRMKTDEAFADVVTAARELGKMSVRRRLFALALDRVPAARPTSLKAAVWLSKQHLGMRERTESEQHVTGDAVIIRIPENGREGPEDDG